MIMSLLLFETEFQNIVAISFTALILNELIMVALEITTWSVLSPLLSATPSAWVRHSMSTVSVPGTCTWSSRRL